MATPRCFLLELPKELRLQIYEYLIKPEEIHLTPDLRFSIGSHEVATATGFRARTQRCAWKPEGEELYLPLLRTCRQIYEEAVPVLNTPNLLALNPARGIAFADEGRVRDISFLSCLSHLTTLEIRVGPHSSRDEELSQAQFFKSLLKKDLRVKVLKMSVEDRREQFDEYWWDTFEPIEEALRLWTWVRPRVGFEYEIDSTGGDDITDRGGWDLRDEKLEWKHGCVETCWCTYDDDPPTVIIDLIKKVFPVPSRKVS